MRDVTGSKASEDDKGGLFQTTKVSLEEQLF